MFADRKDAALRLAQALEPYKDTAAIVLGIPRGGAETAYYVARQLNAHYSLLIARKLGHPLNPEYAFGALAEDGSMYLNHDALSGISQQQILEAVDQQKREIERRIALFRQGKALPDLHHKTVILVDDGIATGATVFAALALCKKQHPAKLVVAVPVAAQDIKHQLRTHADEVVVLETPPFFRAVSQAYESFYNLTDEQALAFMAGWKQEQSAKARFSSSEQ